MVIYINSLSNARYCNWYVFENTFLTYITKCWVHVVCLLFFISFLARFPCFCWIEISSTIGRSLLCLWTPYKWGFMLLLPFALRLIHILLKQDDILHLLRCDVISKRPKTEMPWDIFLQQIIWKLGVQRNNIYATNFTHYQERFLFLELSESNEMIGHNTVNFLSFTTICECFLSTTMQIPSQCLKE
jgi:hypothetical protein